MISRTTLSNSIKANNSSNNLNCLNSFEFLPKNCSNVNSSIYHNHDIICFQKCSNWFLNLSLISNKTKIVNQDNNNISNRKRNTKKLDSNAMDKYARNDLFINSIAKLEQKKNNESTKNAQIERIQQRIENIKNDLLSIKDGFV